MRKLSVLNLLMRMTQTDSVSSQVSEHGLFKMKYM